MFLGIFEKFAGTPLIDPKTLYSNNTYRKIDNNRIMMMMMMMAMIKIAKYIILNEKMDAV